MKRYCLEPAILAVQHVDMFTIINYKLKITLEILLQQIGNDC